MPSDPNGHVGGMPNSRENLEYPPLPTGVEYVNDTEGKFTPERIRQHLDYFVDSVFNELISEYESTGKKIKIIIPLRGGIQIYWELMKRFRDSNKISLLLEGKLEFIYSAKQGEKPNKIYGVKDEKRDEDVLIYLVDDIYDSGESLDLIRENYPGREIRTRYAATKEGINYTQTQNGDYEMIVYPFVWITNTFGMDSSFSTFYKFWKLFQGATSVIPEIEKYMAELEALERLGTLPIQIAKDLKGYEVFQSWTRDPNNFQIYMNALRIYNYYLLQGKEDEFEALKALYRALIENEDDIDKACSKMMTEHIKLSYKYARSSVTVES